MTLPASSPDIRICAVAEVSRHLGWATHTISILQRKIQHERPDWKAAGIPALEQTFDDIQHVDTLRMKQRKGEPPEERHILEIIRFARRLPPGARLLVHCEMGISRSAAAALTVLSALEPHTQPAALIDRLRKQRPEIYPNPLMMLHADRLLGRNGALIQAVNAYHQHQIRAWEIRMADPATREQLGLRMEGDPTTT